MKDLIIAGHSGFAKEIEWLISRINEVQPTYNFLGYLDTEPSEDVIGDDSYVEHITESTEIVIAIADVHLRKRLYELYSQNPLISFPNVIDPSVIMSSSVTLGQGNIICAGDILTVGITLGDFNIINLDCTVGHEAVFGSYITVNPSVNISGNVTLNDFVNIGTGTQVLQGKSIGEDTVIGAGAVVNKSLEGHCTAVGVPARVIKGNN